MINIKQKSFQRLILIIAMVWYVVTAYFSIGYFHPDEHFQIIEFAGIIDGSKASKDLTWEYNARIRPALQPVICYSIFELCKFCSITDPYDKAFLLRLITGLLSVLIIFLFTNSVKSFIRDKYRNLFLILSYFIWFLPFVNVRFSSETWSGITLLLALSIILSNKNNFKFYLISGFLLGLSFLFRYQIAFALIGLALWLLFVKKESRSGFFLMITAGFVAILLGFLVDSWFYGHWTITIWNYFKTNLINGKAAEFGTSPWYYYIFYIFRFSFFPFGILIIVSFFFLLYRKFNNIFVWIILPFIVFQSFISHKELRFLFPLINLIPVVIILSIQELSCVKWNSKSGIFIKGLSIFLLAGNMVGVVAAGIKPAGDSRIKLAKEIHKMKDKKTINVFYTNNSNPFSPWGINSNFYIQKNMKFNKLEIDNQPKLIYPDISARNVLVVSLGDSRNIEIQKFINNMKMKEKCKGVQEILSPVLWFYGYKFNNILVLYSDE